MSNTVLKHEPRMEISQITENIYVGTSMCCVEHAKHHCERMREMGIYADIDLRKGNDETPYFLEVHLKLPVDDTCPPSPTQTKIGVDLIESVAKDGKKIYVHCQAGLGRSPTLVAAYFMLVEGLNAEDAVARVQTGRPEANPTGKQWEFLSLLEESLQ